MFPPKKKIKKTRRHPARRRARGGGAAAGRRRRPGRAVQSFPAPGETLGTLYNIHVGSNKTKQHGAITASRAAAAASLMIRVRVMTVT